MSGRSAEGQPTLSIHQMANYKLKRGFRRPFFEGAATLNLGGPFPSFDALTRAAEGFAFARFKTRGACASESDAASGRTGVRAIHCICGWEYAR